MTKIYTAAIVIIGNEILSGRTQDANLAFLAKGLNEMGIQVAEARVIADDAAVIAITVNEARQAHDYVFTTGGIGPTHDDITAASIAQAFGVALRRDEAAAKLLAQYYGADRLTDVRLRMADIPDGATLIANPVSAAPGFQIGNVYVLAGVPAIAQAMFDGIKAGLAGGQPVLSRGVALYVGESEIAMELSAIQDRHRAVQIGSYPFFRQGKFGTSLVTRGTDLAVIEQAVEEIRALGRARHVDYIDEPWS